MPRVLRRRICTGDGCLGDARESVCAPRGMSGKRKTWRSEGGDRILVHGNRDVLRASDRRRGPVWFLAETARGVFPMPVPTRPAGVCRRQRLRRIVAPAERAGPSARDLPPPNGNRTEKGWALATRTPSASLVRKADLSTRAVVIFAMHAPTAADDVLRHRPRRWNRSGDANEALVQVGLGGDLPVCGRDRAPWRRRG